MSFDPGTGRVLQEILYDGTSDGAWRMLCGCILLNLTTRAQVDGVRKELFERWPHALAMADSVHEEVEEVIRPLGLYARRARTLTRFSGDWLSWEVVQRDVDHPLPTIDRVSEMYGIGPYALDSYRIFVLGERLHPEDVKDRVLARYLALQNDPQVP